MNCLDGCLRRFSERVETFVDRINSLSSENYVDVGVYMLSESVPQFSLDRGAVQLIARLGTSLDLDIVLYETTDGKKETSM